MPQDPYAPSDIYALLRYHMIYAHNMFKSGYDGILKRLEDPPMDDIKNFVGYCDAWAQMIDTHHDSEETVMFPFLNKKMDFSEEIEAHKVIHANLDNLLALIREFKADYSKFDPEKLKKMLVDFKEPLYTHLDGEIEHLQAQNLKSAGFSEQDLKDMIVGLEEYAKSHGDPFITLPFVRSHTPPEIKEYWPTLPWFFRRVVIPYILGMKFSGYWKYAPYSL